MGPVEACAELDPNTHLERPVTVTISTMDGTATGEQSEDISGFNAIEIGGSRFCKVPYS